MPGDIQPENIDLDRVLGVTNPIPGNEQFRAKLLAQTTRVIRRRRRVRQSALIAACVGFYVAGLLTVPLTRNVTSGEQEPNVTVARPDPAKRVPTSPQHSPLPRTRPVLAEQPAASRRPSRFEALRDLGDRYLLERQDPEGAVRCYRLALKTAGPAERTDSSVQGTWLFRALQQDYFKERSDENLNG